MEKTVRIGKVEDQDNFRRDDIRNMSPDARVNMMLEMQSRFCRWDLNPEIKRIVKVKKVHYK
ncbi:MAG: hypothetical protein PHV82_10765 [Victivallaceae bacterium]|nr:hypothetical protein [Victivallaceae bacterium]